MRDLRHLGSPALDACWVACGRLHGFYEGPLYPWDIAAGKLIATEAGAKAGHYGNLLSQFPEDIDGQNVLISSPGIFDELKSLLDGE